jgi:hypothetical protein
VWAQTPPRARGWHGRVPRRRKGCGREWCKCMQQRHARGLRASPPAPQPSARARGRARLAVRASARAPRRRANRARGRARPQTLPVSATVAIYTVPNEPEPIALSFTKVQSAPPFDARLPPLATSALPPSSLRGAPEVDAMAGATRACLRGRSYARAVGPAAVLAGCRCAGCAGRARCARPGPSLASTRRRCPRKKRFARKQMATIQSRIAPPARACHHPALYQASRRARREVFSSRRRLRARRQCPAPPSPPPSPPPLPSPFIAPVAQI